MRRRSVLLLALVALLIMAVVPAALAGAGGTDRPFKGDATGHAVYGYGDGQGTYGLSNVFDCDEGAGLPEEIRDFFRVTTFTSADGTASHLGKVHMEFAHCPNPFTGPVDGQLAIVAANGDVLYGEYDGMGEGGDDGILVTFLPEKTAARDSCELLHGVPCESTGRFADASGSAVLKADAMPSDEVDLFQPWTWWGSWKGQLSY
jgi:hypothetical protein